MKYIDNLSDDPATTNYDASLTQPASHPVANLVLVALIIIGFCVFVAWYAKKNQIASDGGKGDEDNGYLWGLNQQSSPSQEDRMRMGMDERDRRHNNKHKRGGNRHKPLSQFDEDQLDQQMNIQMTMQNNNDLLTITPDHVGRLQTRAPNQMAPNAPIQTNKRSRNKRDKKKQKRRGKGATFEQVKDDEDPYPDNDDISESDDSESGEDMMKMRDQYYASQTFGKKLADTLGDIKDTGTAIAQAVQSKLMKKEATVVRPMQMGGSRPSSTKSGDIKKGKKTKKERRPFTMVDDNETTEDGFDLSDSSNSTKEDEYREDPETEVRMNIHGRKIKQPMALPTFDDDEDEEVDLTASHNDDNIKKNKKKRRKDKKKKKKKEKKEKKLQQQQEQEQQSPQYQEMPQSQTQTQPDEIPKEKVLEVNTDKVEIKNESHDINITINNDDNMGFGTDELEDDQHDLNVNELTKQTQETKLSQEEQDMYLKELENSLMGGGNDMDITQSVDLSAFESTTNELSNGNGVVGNGNGVIPHEN